MERVIIEVHISRPFLTLALAAGAIGVFSWALSSSEGAIKADLTAAGGSDTGILQQDVKSAEEDIRLSRIEREVLERKEQILRYQLRVLEEDQKKMAANMTPELLKEYRRTHQQLLDLLRDKREAELHILETLRQLWEAEVRGRAIGSVPDGHGKLDWPVTPKYGISAHFMDEGYEERFGMPHQAIDIPVLQGTEILAPAAGTIEKIADNGLGYNYLIVRHEGMGLATLYGHVEEFLVHEGEKVEKGQPIALSGGRPGSRGAGAISTGPHVHMEVITDGKRVDPLLFLADQSSVSR